MRPSLYKGRKFSSTWSMNPVSGLLKISWESYLVYVGRWAQRWLLTLWMPWFWKSWGIGCWRIIFRTRSCPRPVSEAQRDVPLTNSATLINDEYRYASRGSRSSAPADPVLGGNPTTLKRGHQDIHRDISSDTHYSANTDNNHNSCDTSDEDQRPAKRRKPRSASTVTPTTSRRHALKVHVRQAGPFVALSAATPEIDDA